MIAEITSAPVTHPERAFFSHSAVRHHAEGKRDKVIPKLINRQIPAEIPTKSVYVPPFPYLFTHSSHMNMNRGFAQEWRNPTIRQTPGNPR